MAVVAFADEEGGRFRVPTFGSRVLAGALDPPDVLGRTDQDGVTMAAAMAAAGVDPETLGPDPARVGRLGAFVELHVEQGRGLVDLGQPVGLGTGIWPHGRWRLTLTSGQPRRDDPAGRPARPDAGAGRGRARRPGGRHRAGRGRDRRPGRGRAELGQLGARPGVGLAGREGRGGPDPRLAGDRLPGRGGGGGGPQRAQRGAGRESRSPAVEFDGELTARVYACLRDRGLEPVGLRTAAGHDAGALAAAVPTAMLFVRNPTGASHSPGESAELEGCPAGVHALATVIEELACR